MKESCIKRFGGKGGNRQRKILTEIVELIKKSKKKIFVDVFGGSGVVSLNVEDMIIKYNDKSQDLYNFFEILKDEEKSEEFKKIIRKTLYYEVQYKKFSDEIRNTKCSVENIPDVDRAVKFYVTIMQSMYRVGDASKAGFKQSIGQIRRGKSQVISAWQTNINTNLDNTIEKFKSIEVFGDDFRKCINRFDSDKTVFYLDPPYVKETRKSKKVYVDELEDEDHKELVKLLLGIKGKAVLSGYDNEIYRELEKNGWKRIEMKVKTATAQNENDRIEVLWTNI